MVKTKYDYPVKDLARELYRNFILKHFPKKKERKELKVICFPGAEALEITQVYDPLKIPRENIVGLEIEKEIYEQIKRKDLGIELYNIDARDFFQNYKGDKFDIVSLDYTGMFTRDKAETIYYVFQNALADRGILHTVFFGARDRRIENVYGVPCDFYEKMIFTEMRNFIWNVITEQNEFSLKDIFPEINTIIEYFYSESKHKIEKTKEGIREKRDLGITLWIISIAQNIEYLNIPKIDGSLEKIYLEAPLNNLTEAEVKKAREFKKHLLKKASQVLANQKTLRKKHMIINGDAIWKYVAHKYGNRRVFVPTDIERYRYISDDGSPMIGDILFFENISVFYKHDPLSIYLDKEDNPHIIITWKGYSDILSGFEKFNRKEKRIRDIPPRKFLGSSYKPKATKELLRKAVMEGKTDEEIYAMFRDVNPRQLAAIKAYKTMGTYDKIKKKKRK